MGSGNQDVQSNAARKIRSGMLVGIIAGCGWMLLVAACERSFAGNQIWLVGSEYDAGVLQAGQPFAHRVWLINPTPRHIRIRPESTCGCTVAEMEFKELTPFNGTPVTIQIDTMQRKPGDYQEKVELVMTSGSKAWREQIRIRFRITAASYLSAKP